MSYQSGSTYAYSYSVSKPGTFTVEILLLQQGGMLAQYYNNTGFTGLAITSEYIPLYKDYGCNLSPGFDENSTAIYSGFIFPPVTGTISFRMESRE